MEPKSTKVEAEYKDTECKDNETEFKNDETKCADIEKQEKAKTKKKIVTVSLIVAVIVLFLIIFAIYGYAVSYYQSHFFPNTIINGVDCSNLQVSEVVSMVDSQIQDYKLVVSGRVNEEGENGVIGEISPQDIDLHFVDTILAVEFIMQQQNPWLWIDILKDEQYNHTLQQEAEFDEELVEAYVKTWDAFENMNAPQNAYISDYIEEQGSYEILPETAGNEVDVQKAIDCIKNAIVMEESSIDLEEEECYKVADVTSDNKSLNESVDTVNQWLETAIIYDWNGNEVIVDREMIREWVSFENNEPQLDEEAVAAFVTEKSKAYDTYGKSRKFVTTLGVELTLPSGAYGWRTDCEGETEELLSKIYQGVSEKKEPLYSNKARQKGTNDIGSSYVEADLTNQHLYLYYQGNLVLETDFVSGNMTQPGCITPYGVFGLTYKTTNAVLRGADYVTPVSYWMPFHGNFGMHDATWRTEFGGDIYLTDGSHGCLNLPLDKAEAIYGYLSTGFPIICYYY